MGNELIYLTLFVIIARCNILKMNYGVLSNLQKKGLNT